MKQSQKLAVRASEIRARLAEIAGMEELTDEVRAESGKLRTEMTDVETRYQAAVTSEAEAETRSKTDGSDREYRALVEGASIGDVFTATLEYRATTGQTLELQQHLSLGANQIPLALLEVRAVTPAPTDVGQQQAEIIPGVFPMSCAAFLGVDMPTVAVGDAVYPVLTTNATAHTPAENAGAAETTGAFSADVLQPSRIQASFFYSREDRARFQGMDAALRMNLSDALSDKFDQQILNGTNGLFNGTNLANNNVSAVSTYATYKSNLAYGRVDGTWVSGVMDLRIVSGSATYAHAATAYRGNNADQSVLDELMAKTGGVKVSAHVPAAASNKQNVVVRLGMRRDMVAPMWEGVTLIPDEITKAANGQIVITAVMQHAVKILRTGGFHKQQTQHA